ncbi:CAMK/CAMKL/CHK1 protein kinase [Rhodocollybia butyracea]|uniref:non-specific serine/threonine protein kinase n=1 Tax=Rhodocollybia butyracea TaxID=206335 RepID=A0A9P5U3K3_9AGAR|nr:CAMK/CAMKL/CHK1 protein kinase [Rhodocollybia butyracea]
MSAKYAKVLGYDLIQQIGGGGFSTVFRAVNLEEHRVAACKLVSLNEQTTEKERKTIEKEIRIHSILKHVHVLEFIGAVTVEPKHKDFYVPGIYMLLELAAGGDLFDKIAPDIGVGDEVAHLYFNQLLSGMKFIHERGVCHRDLKPENLLLDVAGNLKISDFGLSAVFKLSNGKTRSLSERCGSLPYVAPELNTDETYFAEPVDIWGIGVILFTMLAGNTPWDEPTRHSPEFRRYKSGEIFEEDPWNRLGQTALSLICSLLTVNPAERMTLSAAMQHPWCIRASQLARQSTTVLADKLTQSLRANGDMDYVMPASQQHDMDVDGDVNMQPAAHNTQFTQTLMLFSQTQNGTRYTPHLTRFYASIEPVLLMPIVKGALEGLGIQCKAGASNGDMLKMRVGGHDKRKMPFKGWVEIENFEYRGVKSSFCVMSRDEGNPLSWRQMWKLLLQSPDVAPHVLKK